MYNILIFYKNFLQRANRICRNFSCTTTTTTQGDNLNLKIPPEPTTCCMSGCANCVWIEYAEALMKSFNNGGEKARKIILDKVSDPNMRAFLNTELRILEMKAKASSNGKPEES